MSAATASRFLAIGFAVLAAVLYGISSPVSKMLLDSVPPALLAALLYLGAGIGMGVVSLVQAAAGRRFARHRSAERIFRTSSA